MVLRIPLEPTFRRAPTVDCLIIGGGPAGLTAAIYAGRFGLNVVLLDAGDSRARQIARSHNQVGFPDGISGDDLLARMRVQASSAGATLQSGVVTAVTRNRDFFTVTLAGRELDARAVLLATGVTNRRPPLTEASHRSALAAGQLRYCPVCDGAEVVDQRIAVLGTGDRGFKEALFLRAHTREVTLVALISMNCRSNSARPWQRSASTFWRGRPRNSS